MAPSVIVEDSCGRAWTLRPGSDADREGSARVAAGIVVSLAGLVRHRGTRDLARMLGFCAEVSCDLAWREHLRNLSETGDSCSAELAEGITLSLLRAVATGRLTITRVPAPAVFVWEPAGDEPPPPPPGVVDELMGELTIELFDAFGRPVRGRCDLEIPRGTSPISLPLNGQGAASRRTEERALCGVAIHRATTPLEIEPPPRPALRIASARPLPTTELGTILVVKPRSVPHSFQLERRTLTVVELEHFFPSGALLVPLQTPAALRDGAPVVLGIDALRAAHSLLRSRQAHVVGHHDSLSRERAEGVAHLLTGARDEWASLATRTGNEDEKRAFREWASHADRPLPPADAEWTNDDWGAVFDRYRSALGALPAPAGALRHKLVVRSASEERETIYPAKMAEITFGRGHAGRARELEDDNPHLLRGPSQWRDIVAGDQITMPEAWPPEPLIARGFRVLPLSVDPPTVEVTNIAAPRVTGCGARHESHPYADSPARRAKARHVEIVVDDGEAIKTCSHDGTCDTSTCNLYDPIVTELAWKPLAASAKGRLLWCTSHEPRTVPATEISLVVFSLAGEKRLTVPYTAGRALAGGGRSFDVEVVGLDTEGFVQLRRGDLPLEHPVRVSLARAREASPSAMSTVKELPQ